MKNFERRMRHTCVMCICTLPVLQDKLGSLALYIRFVQREDSPLQNSSASVYKQDPLVGQSSSFYSTHEKKSHLKKFTTIGPISTSLILFVFSSNVSMNYDSALKKYEVDMGLIFRNSTKISKIFGNNFFPRFVLFFGPKENLLI